MLREAENYIYAMLTSEVHLETTSSTMEAARELAAGQDFLLVSASSQSGGKGTRGRVWLSHPGNVYMTVGIHRRYLSPARMALLPLEAGVHLWETANRFCRLRNQHESDSFPILNSAAPLFLKWPNDLMLRSQGESRKTAGILIESYGEFFMVGIGVNVAAAPEIKDGGNPGASLSEAGMDLQRIPEFIQEMYLRFQVCRFSGPESEETPAVAGDQAYAENLLLSWQGKVDWDEPQRLRDRPGQPKVQPISINQQGHLLVRHENGSTEWLVADYLA